MAASLLASLLVVACRSGQVASFKQGGVVALGSYESTTNNWIWSCDQALLTAVQRRWDALLSEYRTLPSTGTVVVAFSLLPSGRVTKLRVVESTVEAKFASTCVKAISAPAPFASWPKEMPCANNNRDVRLTFHFDEKNQ
ncbi:MAG TPA: energy transducer TonB [Clostridia bacterium]|nr:energy transducer TonB [Clostridia bacterium]